MSKVREIRNGKLRCPGCKRWKLFEEFGKSKLHKTGYKSRCKKCDAEYRQKNRKRISERMKKFQLEHPRYFKRYKQKYYQKHREEILKKAKIYQDRPDAKIRRKEWAKIYQQKHKRKLNRYFQINRLLKKYNMTLDDYNKLYNKQHGKCAICGRWQSQLSVDHDHTTGKVRALLCRECNGGIGFLQDDSKICLKAVKYLKKYGK